jgi:hypothetical protein
MKRRKKRAAPKRKASSRMRWQESPSHPWIIEARGKKGHYELQHISTGWQLDVNNQTIDYYKSRLAAQAAAKRYDVRKPPSAREAVAGMRWKDVDGNWEAGGNRGDYRIERRRREWHVYRIGSDGHSRYVGAEGSLQAAKATARRADVTGGLYRHRAHENPSGGVVLLVGLGLALAGVAAYFLFFKKPAATPAVGSGRIPELSIASASTAIQLRSTP